MKAVFRDEITAEDANDALQQADFAVASYGHDGCGVRGFPYEIQNDAIGEPTELAALDK